MLPFLPDQNPDAILVMSSDRRGDEVAQRIDAHDAEIDAFFMDDYGKAHPIWIESSADM